MNQDHVENKPHISVAPMMDWTTRHCRYFHRLISPHAVLFSEMVTTGALIHGDQDRFLRFDEAENPLVLQLGGSNPADLARCSKMAQDYGYDEVNLNCGCPSDRVQNGRIGACLMKEPAHVADCMGAMIEAVDIPVTIKCRIGIDEQDSYEFLDEFVSLSAARGVKRFYIHARKAWLSGLSPKENREIPPLDYERVQRIKEQHPDLQIIVNGGIRTVEEVREHLHNFDGVMIGREAYQNPYMLASLEREFFGYDNMLTREDIVMQLVPYVVAVMDEGVPLKSITRHILGLFHGQKGAKQWKRTLSTLPYEDGAGVDVLHKALEAVRDASAR